MIVNGLSRIVTENNLEIVWSTGQPNLRWLEGGSEKI